MSLVLTAFTQRGTALACRIASSMDGQVYTLPKFQREGTETYPSLSQWTGTHFAAGDDIIFVSAVGIAVRAVAPYLQDKYTDPAILAVDEAGRFVVPVLSGHIGGANRLARQVAQIIGGTAVISTATDVNERFAVDEWAAAQRLPITDRAAAKAISAALLAGEPVGFTSEFPHDPLPEGVTEGEGIPGFTVTCRTDDTFPAGTLVLHPKALAVGIGCKKKLPPERVGEAVSDLFCRRGLALESVFCLASIDIKREDAGIRRLAVRLGVPCRFYTAEELALVEGNFPGSAFVRSVTGVSSVCDRAACLASESGPLLVEKTACDGVTVAVARRDYFVRFEVGE
ncbi:MAG: cobalamin biosynthesis protein [Clostridiales bacterium]|nr:cobalamin biosynthesis protein [Clostridiales bacterium]